MKAFRNPVEYPFFDRYWKLVSSTEEDKGECGLFSYHHNGFGDNVPASSTVSITSWRIVPHSLSPCDDHTPGLQSNKEADWRRGYRFAPWLRKAHALIVKPARLFHRKICSSTFRKDSWKRLVLATMGQ
jgi:hypothetical protein